jgi:ankyrin repeat protein
LNLKTAMNLFEATISANLAAVQEAISAGDNVNATDPSGSTPLMYATSPDIAQLLISAGANVNAFDSHGWTPLLLACSHANAPLAQLLLDHRAEPNVENFHGATPISWAAYHGLTDIVRLLIQRRADVNTPNNAGWTPLMYAKDPEIVQLLLNAKADVNARDTYTWATIFHAPTPQILQLLLDHGADTQHLNVNAIDYLGRTPLIAACQANNIPLAQLLIDRGANINTRDNAGNSALQLTQNPDLKQLLLDHKNQTPAINRFTSPLKHQALAQAHNSLHHILPTPLNN